jgi:hypothetical protein
MDNGLLLETIREIMSLGMGPNFEKVLVFNTSKKEELGKV